MQERFLNSLSILLIAFFISFGCREKGGGNEDSKPEIITFTGTLTSFLYGTPVEGAAITLLDNDTGAETGVKTKSGANGKVEFQIEKGKKFGLKATLGNHLDTYQFNMDVAQDEILWIVANQTVTLAARSSGLSIDAEKGIVAGTIYWENPNEEEEHVGCATIESYPEGDIRYTDSTGFPVPPESAKSTNKDKSYFFLANILPGKVSIKTKMDATELGMVSSFTYKGAIGISNIYATGKKNPTPENCLR
ncbi:MAG: hypothetical protein FJ088_07550 [Deltaproteobacteria bacterium]|nr:hypothetical protein [Deltaproteobacteria bacterium]